MNAPKTPKPTIPIIEGGTTIAPRQRPKANQQPSHNLTLGLPPSPSPRNILSSPVLGAQDCQQIQQQGQPPSTIPQLKQNFNMPAPEVFPVQFDTNFPSPPAVAPASIVQSSIQQTHNTSNSNLNTQSSNSNLDNLFQSSYPDPFRETSAPTTTSKSSLTRDQEQFLSQEEIDNIPQQLLVGPKTGHRRNMSDTSAFNK